MFRNWKMWQVAIFSQLFFLSWCFHGSALALQESKGNVFTWRLQSVFPSSSLGYSLATKFCDTVKMRTNGEVQITVFPPGALAKPLETFDLVAVGAVEMAFSAGAYHARKIPVALAESGLPMTFSGELFSAEGPRQAYEFLYEFKGGQAMKILREGYTERKTHLLATGASSAYVFMTRFPAEKLDDFRGKKIRCAGLYCSLIQNIGASPVTLPGAEQYMALQRGTVDGTAYVCYTLDTYNLKEVVKYIVTPPILPCIFVDFYVNLETWTQLPEKTRKIVNDVALECFQWFTDASLRADVETVKGAQEKYGLAITKLSKEDVTRLRQAAIPVWEVAAKKSKRSAEFLELLKEFMKYKGILE